MKRLLPILFFFGLLFGQDTLIDTLEVDVKNNKFYLTYKLSNGNKSMEGKLVNNERQGEWKFYHYINKGGMFNQVLDSQKHLKNDQYLKEWVIEYEKGEIVTNFFDYKINCSDKEEINQVFPITEDSFSISYTSLSKKDMPPPTDVQLYETKIWWQDDKSVLAWDVDYKIPTDCGDLIFDFNNFESVDISKAEWLGHSNRLVACGFWDIFMRADKNPKYDFISCSNWLDELMKLDYEIWEDINGLIINENDEKDLRKTMKYRLRYNKYAFCDVNHDGYMDLLIKNPYNNVCFTKTGKNAPIQEIIIKL